MAVGMGKLRTRGPSACAFVRLCLAMHRAEKCMARESEKDMFCTLAHLCQSWSLRSALMGVFPYVASGSSSTVRCAPTKEEFADPLFTAREALLMFSKT